MPEGGTKLLAWSLFQAMQSRAVGLQPLAGWLDFISKPYGCDIFIYVGSLIHVFLCQFLSFFNNHNPPQKSLEFLSENSLCINKDKCKRIK